MEGAGRDSADLNMMLRSYFAELSLGLSLWSVEKARSEGRENSWKEACLPVAKSLLFSAKGCPKDAQSCSSFSAALLDKRRCL